MYLYYLLALIVLSSCSSNENDINEIPEKLKEYRVTGKIVACITPDFHYRKYDVFSLEGYLFIIDLGPKGNPLLSIYNQVSGNFIGSFIQRGEGPDELSTISKIFIKKDTLFAFSVQDQKMLYANHKLLKDSGILNFDYYPFPIQKVSVERVLGIEYFNDSTFISPLVPGINGRFMVFNNRMDSLYTFGKYPKLGREPKGEYHIIDKLVKVHYNLSGNKLAINPYNKDLVSVYKYHLIELYNVSTGLLKKRITGPVKDFPIKDFDINPTNQQVFLSKEHKRAYSSARFSKNKMFIAYNGRKFNGFDESLLSRRIFVFTHDGEFLYSLNPQIDFISFDVNEEGDKLFIIRSYEEGEAYVEFDLSEVG
ncbi:MAG: TolB-like 6-bladed beta-propeller domain-containing protein [Cyclobacteriaceae bacterium]|nr:TolB-like 6-bladed beta-propeller domain-containing protein [Cyclobacteriaceae bacterium]